MTLTQKIGTALIAVALLVLVIAKYGSSSNTKTKVPLVFSQKDMLASLWNNYKTTYVESSTGRTLDKQKNNISTSEGESYTMLRAVWMNDQATFDSSYQWTKNILQHKDDHLFSWEFGPLSNGHYGVLTNQGGQNAATDADTDIALSLLFAYQRWGTQSYLDDAKAIIADIWKYEVVTIQGKPVVTSDNIEYKDPDHVIVNPSYFAPYAYRLFAIVDPSDNWQGAVDNSYHLLQQSASLPLNKSKSANIVPDWIRIDRHTGAIAAVNNGNLTTNYSYDALRTPWRIAMDYQWYKDPRAKSLLDSFSFFSSEWQAHGALSTVYGHDGSDAQLIESPAMYGGVIGYFMVSDPNNAATVYKQKLQGLYNPDTNAWKNTLGYYDDNWAWFGIALYNNLLPNLATGLTSKDATK